MLIMLNESFDPIESVAFQAMRIAALAYESLGLSVDIITNLDRLKEYDAALPRSMGLWAKPRKTKPEDVMQPKSLGAYADEIMKAMLLTWATNPPIVRRPRLGAELETYRTGQTKPCEYNAMRLFIWHVRGLANQIIIYPAISWSSVDPAARSAKDAALCWGFAVADPKVRFVDTQWVRPYEPGTSGHSAWGPESRWLRNSLQRRPLSIAYPQNPAAGTWMSYWPLERWHEPVRAAMTDTTRDLYCDPGSGRWAEFVDVMRGLVTPITS